MQGIYKKEELLGIFALRVLWQVINEVAIRLVASSDEEMARCMREKERRIETKMRRNWQGEHKSGTRAIIRYQSLRIMDNGKHTREEKRITDE